MRTFVAPLRRLAKFLAALNALFIIAFVILQFGGVFDNCWCDSCRLSLGWRAHNVHDLNTGDLNATGTYTWWKVGLGFAGGAGVGFELGHVSCCGS